MPIDVGAACIDRAGSAGSGSTNLEGSNPANATGTIDSVCVYAATDMSGIEFASFADEGSNSLSTNGDTNGSNLSATVAASPKTFTAAGCDFTAFAINTGEYIGAYWSGGNLEKANAGVGKWDVAGDQVPCSSVTFSWTATRVLSIYATGAEVGAPVSLTIADFASATTIADAVITRLRSLGITDLASVTTITTAAVQVIVTLGITDLASVTAITNATIGIVTPVAVTDLASSTAITNAVITRLRALGITDLASATVITNAVIGVTVPLGITDLASLTAITTAAISRLRALGITDLSSATVTTTVAIAIVTVLAITDLTSATVISAAALTRLRTLALTNLASVTTISNSLVRIVSVVIGRRMGLLVGIY